MTDLQGAADRVLVDVPCSGTGAWRRDPASRWRLTPAALDELVALQGRLLDQAAVLVRPGGRLSYATCSLLPEENQRAVERFLSGRREFTVLPIADVWPEAVGTGCPLPGPHLLLDPARHGTDGFFAAILVRQA